MKGKYSLFLLALLICSANLKAQSNSINAKQKIKITEVYISMGFIAQNNYVSSLSDFKKLAPQSVLLDNSFNGYSSYPNTYSDNGGFTFSALAGIKFLNQQKSVYKSNPHLRLGVSYLNGLSMSRSLVNEVTKPYDTLTSSQTGEIILIDSVATDNYYMRYCNEQIRLHASFVFRTNPEARWTLYGGAGITAGMSFNAHTEITHDYIKSTTSKNGSGEYIADSFGDDEYSTEEFANKSGFGFSAFIPVGIDFRMGNKLEFWKRLHLYIELSPQIDFTSVPELRTFTSSGATASFGLKVVVD